MPAMRHPPEVREHAKALFLQGLMPKRISTVVGVPVGTIAQWRKRGHWADLLADDRQNRVQTRVVTVRDDRSGSEELRASMAQLLAEHTGQLRHVTKKPNLDHLAKVGAVLETFARTAKTVHNWGNEPRAGLVLIDDLASMKRAIATPETTTNSVPAVIPESVPPPEPQPVEPQATLPPESSHNSTNL